MNPHYPAVARRANHRCEYCRAPEAIFNFPFEVEHVLPSAAGGSDDESNLALTCRSCNVHKSSHLTGPDGAGGAEVIESLHNSGLGA
jgi:5-methylcytosine-specific restriction endonuclease McrA